MPAKRYTESSATDQADQAPSAEPLSSIPFAPRALPAEIPFDSSPSAVMLQPPTEKAATHGALHDSMPPTASAPAKAPEDAPESVSEKGDDKAAEALTEPTAEEADRPASHSDPIVEEVQGQQGLLPASTGQAHPQHQKQPLVPATSAAAAAAVAAAISAAAAAAEEGQGATAPSGSHGAHQNMSVHAPIRAWHSRHGALDMPR